jgi:hypothetical protein
VVYASDNVSSGVQSPVPLRQCSDGLTLYTVLYRKVFKVHRMWPAFIGPKIIKHGVERVAPPVLLWKEQKA